MRLAKEASQIKIPLMSLAAPGKSAASARRRKAAPVTKVKTKTAAQLTDSLYYYQAKVKEVYDGDTITVDIDLGMHLWLYGEKIRLIRINAPEVRGDSRERGLASRDYLRSLLDGKDIVLETYKDDREKYGRFLAEIWVQIEGRKTYTNVNDLLVQQGFAEYHDYS